MPQSGKRIIGIIAHVDSGKTTLAEGLLFHGGSLRSLGRVDHGDSFLDTLPLERQRGITIFSKLARLEREGEELILLDTPGHADFSPEMERVLSVLDYAVLVVSGPDGVTARLKRLWQLLARYEVPVFLFVNKMDQPGTLRSAVYEALRSDLSDHILDFSGEETIFSEETATVSEELLEEYLSPKGLRESSIAKAISIRQIFPCWFGSALKDEGVREFLEGIFRWTIIPEYPEEFSGRVLKIFRDEEGHRLTEIKVTGGSLRNRTLLGEEKITELRLYSGGNWINVQEAAAGDICAAAGLKETFAGQGLGLAQDRTGTSSPVLSHRITLAEGGDENRLLQLLRQVEEEMPELKVTFQEENQEIFVHIMGEVLLDVLADLLWKRGRLKIRVDEGSILYRESLAGPVIGIGHYEPLRHYAEVQLLLEPLDIPGSEIIAVSGVDGNGLAPAWQSQILSQIRETVHPGVLLGAPLSGIRMTLLAGRSHEKHTSGGDFREATRRAIRQGLMTARQKGQAALLEPEYEFEIMVAAEQSGRILTDLSLLKARDLSSEILEDGRIRISGLGPVKTLRSYPRELQSLSRGDAQMRFSFAGYARCHDETAILGESTYDPEADLKNPAGSIFVSQGSTIAVPWPQVPDKAHIPPVRLPVSAGPAGQKEERPAFPSRERTIDPEEVDRLLAAAGSANVNPRKKWRRQRRRMVDPAERKVRAARDPQAQACLIIDGYNVIHAWPELHELARVNFDAAREKLQDILHDYQGYTGETVLLIFDAYRVERGAGSESRMDGLHVIFTRENQTADQYIEAKVMELGRDHPVKVVTSDRAEQMSALGSGALVYSARRFLEIIREVRKAVIRDYDRKKDRDIPYRPLMNSPISAHSDGTGSSS